MRGHGVARYAQPPRNLIDYDATGRWSGFTENGAASPGVHASYDTSGRRSTFGFGPGGTALLVTYGYDPMTGRLNAATGVGAPIGASLKGGQVALELGLLGINAYDAVVNGSSAPLVGQAAGGLSSLAPGAMVTSKTAKLLRGGQPRNASGQFRRSKLDTDAARQAAGSLQERAGDNAAQVGACIAQ